LARLFLASFLAGAAVVLVAVVFFPLPSHTRYASNITVVPNGGRREDFVIHWPQDRIPLPEKIRPTAHSVTAGTLVLTDPQAPPASGELFRLHDIQGNLIGVASKTTTLVIHKDHEPRSVSNWILMIPGRGTLFLSQLNQTDLSPLPVPDAPGQYIAPAESARFWSTGSRYRVTAGPAADGSGRVLRGTEEFAALSGTYSETWQLDGSRPDGTTEGRISLSTLLATVQ